MPCLKDEYARGKAENAKNEVRDKGARKQGAKRTGTGGVACAPPVASLLSRALVALVFGVKRGGGGRGDSVAMWPSDRAG